MKKILALLTALFSATAAFAQNATQLPVPVQSPVVTDFGNGPLKLRVVQTYAYIFTSQGSGTGGTSGASTTLTLTATPTTPPIIGGYISGAGITDGTMVAGYNGTTTITLSAAMTVAPGTALSWGAACPSIVPAGAQYIQASVMTDYLPLYTRSRVCAASPGGPLGSLLVLPYNTASGSNGGTPGGTNGQIQFNNGGAFGGFTASGDFTINTATGVGTLATVNSNTGSFGSATQCVSFTTNGKGLITAASQTACTPAFASITGQVTLAQLPTIGANTVLGSVAGGTPIALSQTQLTSLVNACTATANGAVPAAGSSTGKVLRDDCTWVNVAGTGTVTSVGVTAGVGITQSGSPVTTSGNITVNVDKASAANYYAAASNKVPTTDVIYPPNVAITYGTTTNIDFSTFNNGTINLIGNITTMNVSNVIAGKSGRIRFIQDATGSRTTVWNSTFKFAGGTTPSLTTTANAVDVLYYDCETSPATVCYASLNKDMR